MNHFFALPNHFAVQTNHNALGATPRFSGQQVAATPAIQPAISLDSPQDTVCFGNCPKAKKQLVIGG